MNTTYFVIPVFNGFSDADDDDVSYGFLSKNDILLMLQYIGG
jgi:hypothetical protein